MGIRRFALVLSLLFIAPPGVLAQEPLKLRFSHFLPAQVFTHAEVFVPWVEEVKKRSNGRLEITIFPAGQLCKPPLQYECARDGLADISFGVPGFTPGRFPMTAVMELPYMHRTAATGSQMLTDLWPEYLSKEYNDVSVLMMNMQPAGHVHTSSKPVPNMAALKGLKLRAPTAVTGDLIELMGAAKVGVQIQETYEAVSQKTIDGFILNYAGLPGFRLQEVARNHTEVAMYSVAFAMFANKKRMDSLPPDLRQILIDTTSPSSGYWKRVGAIWDAAEARARQLLVNQKDEIIVLSAEERARWREVAKPLDAKWAEALDKRNLPGRKLLDAARGLSAKYGEAN